MHSPPKFCNLIAVFIMNLYLNFISKIWKITYFLKTCKNCISDCIKDKIIVHSYVTLLHKSKFLYLNFISKFQNNRNSLNYQIIFQIALAVPFLLENPVGYIVRSFNFGRQFFYVWTVNWRLIPEDIFLNKYFQTALLLCHVVVLVVFFLFKWRR